MGDSVEQDISGGKSHNIVGVQNINNAEEENLGIIDEIYSQILSRRKRNRNKFINKKTSELPTKLLVKLKLNFTDDSRDRMDLELKNNWELKSLVQEFIEEKTKEDNTEIEDLVYIVQQDFMKIAKARTEFDAIKDPNIFDELSELYLPKKNKQNPTYRRCARAMLHHFFEHCDFGRKQEGQS